MTVESQIVDVLLSLDDTAETALFAGQHDVSISTRCGMALLKPVELDGHRLERKLLQGLGAGLDAIQKGHCYTAILGDYARAQAVIALLGPYIEPAKQALDALGVKHA